MSQEPDIRQNYKMYQTILELLEARSYVVPEDKKNLTFEQFAQRENNQSTQKQLFTKIQENQETETNQTIAVMYNFKRQKITTDLIQKIAKSAQTFIKNIFIVVGIQGNNGVLKADKPALATINDLNRSTGQTAIHIELFKDEDLMFNIMKHDLVPKHMLLSQGQKVILLKKYKVKETQLPKILLSDPVSKFLGLKRGQVVKIERKSETAGIYTTYRIAV